MGLCEGMWHIGVVLSLLALQWHILPFFILHLDLHILNYFLIFLLINSILVIILFPTIPLIQVIHQVIYKKWRNASLHQLAGMVNVIFPLNRWIQLGN